MEVEVRNYKPEDYEAVAALYKQSALYGGQFDEARDTAERLNGLVAKKPEAILVAESDENIVGTVTLFEDGRSAWLYRFAVVDSEHKGEVAEALYTKAKDILRRWGHTQVLVYAPAGDPSFEKRYTALGFNKGNDFAAYWQDI